MYITIKYYYLETQIALQLHGKLSFKKKTKDSTWLLLYTMYCYSSLFLSLSLSLSLSTQTYLVFMARSLAVLGQCDQCLCDELHIVGMNVETQQHQATRGHSTHTVKELKCLQNQVVTVLAMFLLTKVVLGGGGGGAKSIKYSVVHIKAEVSTKIVSNLRSVVSTLGFDLKIFTYASLLLLILDLRLNCKLEKTHSLEY